MQGQPAPTVADGTADAATADRPGKRKRVAAAIDATTRAAIRAAARQLVDSAPPLTGEVRARLASLLSATHLPTGTDRTGTDQTGSG